MKNFLKRDLVMLDNYTPNVPSFFHALLHGITSYAKGFYKFYDNVEQCILGYICRYNRYGNYKYALQVFQFEAYMGF